VRPKLVDKLPTTSMTQNVRQSLIDAGRYAKKGGATQAIVIIRKPCGQMMSNYAGCTLEDKIAILEIAKQIEIQNAY